MENLIKEVFGKQTEDRKTAERFEKRIENKRFWARVGMVLRANNIRPTLENALLLNLPVPENVSKLRGER
jgi:hypothetical protein